VTAAGSQEPRNRARPAPAARAGTDLAGLIALVARGEVEVMNDAGGVIKVLSDGDVFGEIGVLLSRPRNADVRAKTACDLFVLDKADFSRILRDSPQFAQAVQQVARERYNLNVQTQALIAPH